MRSRMQHGLRILVADDNEALRENLVECLEEEGHVVAQARDGRDALGQLARSGRPDVLVLDLVMPGLSGTEVAAAVRRDPTLRDLRLVLMTAREGGPGKWPEFDAVLTKPFPLGAFIAAIECPRR
jgi:CheY-like chemotaxis protein